MIVSHKYKFIFLKTRKTAGTSLEIGLSRFCGSGDIITPITKEDELLRMQMGNPGPQNYTVPFKRYRMGDWKKLVFRRRRLYFFNHMRAVGVRRYLGPDVWNTYFKFSFERNPFDRAVSLYHWKTRKESQPPVMEDYLASVSANVLSNWQVYTIADEIAVDFLGRYEYLNDDIAEIERRIGLPEKVVLPRAKGDCRKDRRHYSVVLNDRARAHIERTCHHELTTLGYSFEVA